MKRFTILLFFFVILSAAKHLSAQSPDNPKVKRIDFKSTSAPPTNQQARLYFETDSFKARLPNGTIFVFGGGDSIADYCPWDTTSTAIIQKDTTLNVGIGTTTPTAKLHVVGDTNLIRMTATFDGQTISILSGKNIDGSPVDGLLAAYVDGDDAAFSLVGYNAVGQLCSRLFYESDTGAQSSVGAYYGQILTTVNDDAGIDVIHSVSDPEGVLIQGKGTTSANNALTVFEGNATDFAGDILFEVRNDGQTTIPDLGGNGDSAIVTASNTGVLSKIPLEEISPWTSDGTETYLRNPAEGVVIGYPPGGYGYSLFVAGNIYAEAANGSQFGAIELEANGTSIIHSINNTITQIFQDDEKLSFRSGSIANVRIHIDTNGLIVFHNDILALDSTIRIGNASDPFETVFTRIISSDVTNPPTDAELDALYGTPATVGNGFTGKVKDSNSNNFYEVVAVGSEWYTFTATLAP